MNNSARRMSIPTLDPDLALRSIVELVRIDRDWVPSTIGTSVYVRPVILAN
jgi:branched-chain amino acid aminotransferase